MDHHPGLPDCSIPGGGNGYQPHIKIHNDAWRRRDRTFLAGLS